MISLNVSKEEISKVNLIRPERVYLPLEGISRFNGIEREEWILFAKEFKSKGIEVYLDWDGPISEKNFKDHCDLILDLKKDYTGVRVQDFGAFNFLKSENIFINLSLTYSTMNLMAVSFWQKYFHKISSLCLLSMWTYKDIKNLMRDYPFEYELTALERINLYYSPRKLLGEKKEVKIDSLESSHKNLIMGEYDRGSALFYNKVFQSITHFNKIERIDKFIKYFDIRGLEISEDFVSALAKRRFDLVEEEIKREKSRYTSAYFLSNFSDKIPRKIAPRPQPKNLVAKVLDFKKGHYTVVKIESKIIKNKTYTLKNPQGKSFTFYCATLKDLDGKDQIEISKAMAILPYIKGGVPKSYLVESEECQN